MLAGPPRVVSLLTVVIILCLGWWYFRLVQSGNSALRVDTSPPPSFKGDSLDFSIPLRFTDGVPKPPGSNYTHALIIPKTTKEDLSWMRNDIPDTPLVVYEVDNPNAEYHVPKNKGREAMVYLTYLIDHYDNLPEIMIFMHAHKYAWHNNQLMGLDAAQIVKRLNHDRVARLGYMNVRCHHDPGCPDWIHMDRPGGDFDFFHKPEEIYWRKNIWEEIHPGAPIPPTLSGMCCAQFAVSRDRVRMVPRERFVHYRKWLMETTMEDQFSGRIFEYIWHYIFTGHEVYCPAMNTCYCDGYGICFGGREKFAAFFEKQDKRNKMFEELKGYESQKEEAQEKGQHFEYTEETKKRMEVITGEVNRMDREMEAERGEALKRGEDPKARAEETETYDSSRIWEYAPKDH